MRRTFFTLFEKSIDLVNDAMYVIIGLAVIGFFWGIVKILFHSDNEIAKTEGRSFMMYGIFTLFVMTSFWGLVNILRGTIEVQEVQEGMNPYIDDIDTNTTGGQFPNIWERDYAATTTSEYEFLGTASSSAELDYATTTVDQGAIISDWDRNLSEEDYDNTKVDEGGIILDGGRNVSEEDYGSATVDEGKIILDGGRNFSEEEVWYYR